MVELIQFWAEDCSKEKESAVGCKVSERIRGQSEVSCCSVSQEGLVTFSAGFVSVCVVPDLNYPTLLAKSIHYISVVMVELGNIPIPWSRFTFANLDGNLESLAGNS